MKMAMLVVDGFHRFFFCFLHGGERRQILVVGKQNVFRCMCVYVCVLLRACVCVCVSAANSTRSFLTDGFIEIFV